MAYADFVTAMMAFFLLMWLMGFTTEGERKAISDYFQNPSAIQGKGGSSTSLIDMGKGMDSPRSSQKKPNQDTMSINVSDSPDESRGSALSVDAELAKKITAEQDKKRLESLMDELKQAIEASQALKPFKDQLFIDISPEGLRVQIVDKENRPMFDVGSANLQSYTKVILREISKVINAVPNRISIAGHTDARAYANVEDYSNWELSTERANACRRELVRSGVGEAKISRVVGLASTTLFDKANPYSPINRRISIVVVSKESEEAMLRKEESQSGMSSEKTIDSASVTPAKAEVTEDDETAPLARPAAAVGSKVVESSAATTPAAKQSSAESPVRASNLPAKTTPVSAPIGVQLPSLPIAPAKNAAAPAPKAAPRTEDPHKAKH